MCLKRRLDKHPAKQPLPAAPFQERSNCESAQRSPCSGGGGGTRSYFDSPSVLNKMAPVLFVFPKRNIWTSAVLHGATRWARVTRRTGAARMHKHMCAVGRTDAQKIHTGRKRRRGRGWCVCCLHCCVIIIRTILNMTHYPDVFFYQTWK